jgi:hypothetical protein
LRAFLGKLDAIAAIADAGFAIVELIVVNVSDKAQPCGRVAVIEDQAMILALRGAKAAADDLHEQNFRFGWASKDDAVGGSRLGKEFFNWRNVGIGKMAKPRRFPPPSVSSVSAAF